MLLSIIGDSDISDIIYDEFRTWIALHGPELVSVPMHEGEGGGGMVLGFYFFLGLLNVWTRRIRRRKKREPTGEYFQKCRAAFCHTAEKVKKKNLTQITTFFFFSVWLREREK